MQINQFKTHIICPWQDEEVKETISYVIQGSKAMVCAK